MNMDGHFIFHFSTSFYRIASQPLHLQQLVDDDTTNLPGQFEVCQAWLLCCYAVGILSLLLPLATPLYEVANDDMCQFIVRPTIVHIELLN